MVNRNQFSAAVQTIRNALDYKRGVAPIVSDIIETEDQLHVIVPDRSEKSLLIGPGGRIAAKLSDTFRKAITIHSKNELLLREEKLGMTLQRISDVLQYSSVNQRQILQQLRKEVQRERDYPRMQINMKRDDTDMRVAVAFSGGVDSGAALYWATRKSMSVISLTADLGYQVMDDSQKIAVRKLAEKLGASQRFIDATSEVDKIFEDALKGKIHPCGQCHSITMECMRNSARDLGFDVLLTGELLPTGRQSIELLDDLTVIHLPAALSLSKYRNREISSRLGISEGQERFGCRLLSRCHQQGWKMIGPSIYRVLRESEAGVLTTGQALQQINNILKPSVEYLKRRNLSQET